ncbi:hypothetical protein LY78DRAFT_146568 [Colletotrichum sublineola]|nr:hypothetical protein LY78DRAFT_146568 [Colletotrichum sublineola]
MRRPICLLLFVLAFLATSQAIRALTSAQNQLYPSQSRQPLPSPSRGSARFNPVDASLLAHFKKAVQIARNDQGCAIPSEAEHVLQANLIICIKEKKRKTLHIQHTTGAVLANLLYGRLRLSTSLQLRPKEMQSTTGLHVHATGVSKDVRASSFANK